MTERLKAHFILGIKKTVLARDLLTNELPPIFKEFVGSEAARIVDRDLWFGPVRYYLITATPRHGSYLQRCIAAETWIKKLHPEEVGMRMRGNSKYHDEFYGNPAAFQIEFEPLTLMAYLR